MAFTADNIELTPRESILMDAEAEERRLAREHAVVIKKLELEEQKIEAKWAALLKLPGLIIKLPVYLLLGIGFIIAAATNHEIPEKFWDYLR